MIENKIYSTVSCNLDVNLLESNLPLFYQEEVDAIEWSFDALYAVNTIPSWFTDLIKAFSEKDRLIGHGVFFSIFHGKWLEEQASWLRTLDQMSRAYTFDHISEHFGFMTGETFHHGAPMSIPYTTASLAIGRDRLMRISDTCQCPVGLENLAFAFSLEDVKQHGAFLHQLMEPVNGFIILDLHNLYCQLHNFSISFDELIKLYPLDLVREIHISGGSFEPLESDPSISIRRDTHDESVPKEVLQLLEKTQPLCPNLKFVTLEQIGPSLATNEAQEQFRKDFIQMKAIISNYENQSCDVLNQFIAPLFKLPAEPVEDQLLYEQQRELAHILELSTHIEDAKYLLRHSILANSAWKIEHWDDKMIETACAIAQKWALV